MVEQAASSGRSGHYSDEDMELRWSEAPWDTAVFGTPVLQIDAIQSRRGLATGAMRAFFSACTDYGCTFASCRMPATALRESMVLEAHGFRFVEMMYRPSLTLQSAHNYLEGSMPLEVTRARAEDLATLVEIAGQAFGNERFHVDPRIAPGVGDLRYQNWVKAALDDAVQQLLVLRENADIVAFFVVEQRTDGTAYWHLNAVNPEMHGRGLGMRAWRTMIAHAQESGCVRVESSISARNVRVMNLYARLGFRFGDPAMTFHWIAGK